MAMTSNPLLAEMIYTAFRSNSPDPASLPAWGNLDTDSRLAWAAAADRAEKLVVEQCANKLETATFGGMLIAPDRACLEWGAQYLRGHV